MEKRWTIIALDRREKIFADRLINSIHQKGLVALVDLLVKPSRIPVVEKLSAPVQPQYSPKYSRTSITSGPSSANLQVLLDSLPNELLLVLFDFLDVRDAFRLSLASERRLRVGWPCLQRQIAEPFGTWAGCRVIVLDENPHGHCPGPPGFLTAQDHDELAQDAVASAVEFRLDDDPDDPGIICETRPSKIMDVLFLASRRFLDVRARNRLLHRFSARYRRLGAEDFVGRDERLDSR